MQKKNALRCFRFLAGRKLNRLRKRAWILTKDMPIHLAVSPAFLLFLSLSAFGNLVLNNFFCNFEV